MQMVFLAGFAAALVAYILNRYLVNRFGSGTIVYLTPIIEEGVKTGFATILEAAIVPVHLIFGLIEGIYDLKTSRYGITAGLMSVAWHAIFGLVTVWLTRMLGNLAYGVLTAILLHFLGNSIIVKPKEESE